MVNAQCAGGLEETAVDDEVRDAFREPKPVERLFNRVFGLLLRLGLGLGHNYVLDVTGRKSGRTFSTPVNLLEHEGRRFLVAPRGRTQWVRNAQARGRVTLRRGRWSHAFALREVAEQERPDLLKAYLDRFRLTVQRYFPVAAGSPAAAFVPIVSHYPVFELIPEPARRGGTCQ